MLLDTLNISDIKEVSLLHADTSLVITLNTALTVSYPAVQNRVPIISALRIENTSPYNIRDLELSIIANPEFILKQIFHFESLLAGEVRSFEINQLNIKPNHTYLASLNEAELGHIEVIATANDNIITHIVNTIEILAHNEWGGTRGLPELLAAFVQPNSLAIDRVLGRAAEILKKTHGNFSLNGYESRNREASWAQISSIYSILNALNLQYALPPASFESTGQKIRSAERILDAKIATCLDLAVLMASCFEQSGLNPVILFNHGHAWVGIWLIENTFSTPIIDNAQSVRKRVASGELLMIEATAITQASKPSLQWASSTANTYLDEEITTFTYAVDIKKARQIYIRAIKENILTIEQLEGKLTTNLSLPVIESMPFLPPLDPALLPPIDINISDSREGRLGRWKSKLLDLTLRNRLLNFKSGNSFLKIVYANPGLLENELSSDKEFKLMARASIMEYNDPRSAEIYFHETGLMPAQDHAKAALSKHQIIFEMAEDEFEANLVKIYRAAKNALEETGANTLYVSLGMLYWQDPANFEIVLKAPLILFPVSLKRGSVGAGIRLIHRDDETLFNPTLIQKLATDFDLHLPFIDGLLANDGKGLDIEHVLQQVRLAITDLKGFEVKPDCYLGNFSFTKYVMWKDLNSSIDELSKSEIVDHLLNHKGEVFVDNFKHVNAKDLDELYHPKNLLIPLLSDSSQLAVIATADQGKNIVVEGPPGTGKSQTITNMIAHFLASGKSVLFVAEKMAALEVVYKRLSALGLDEFCLELHSTKAKKSQIAKELVQTLNSANSEPPEDWERIAQKLANIREELSSLVKVMHSRHKNGLIVYDALGSSIANQGKPMASFNWPSADMHSRDDIEHLNHIITQMTLVARQLDLINHPLVEIGQTKWTPLWQDKFLTQCNLVVSSINQFRMSIAGINYAVKLEASSLSFNDIEILNQVSGNLLKLPPQYISIKQAQVEFNRDRLQELINHGEVFNQVWAKFAADYTPGIRALKADKLRLEWKAANQEWLPKGWFSKNKVTNQIKLYNLHGHRLDLNQLDSFLDALNILNSVDKYFFDNSAFAYEVLGTAFIGTDTLWDKVRVSLDWTANLIKLIDKLSSNHNGVLALYNLIDKENFRPDSNFYNLMTKLHDASNDFKSNWSELNLLAAPNLPLLGENNVPGILDTVLSLAERWLNSKTLIRPWIMWQHYKAAACTAGLDDVVNQLEIGNIELNQLTEFFNYSYQNWWVKKIINREILLANFSGVTQEQRVNEFKKLDEQFQQLTKDYIISTLRAKVPGADEVKGDISKQIAFLRREAQKQRQHKPIRQVIMQTKTIISRLKPCLLMSPLSVAQYLDAGHTQFDVVIFDEASQIPTWDAIGAIARGRQLICVGDPQQLPPTNFFNVTDDDSETNEDEIEEMESILDECLSSGMSQCILDWHYRSKNEGLITFSNIKYYGNRLITFPSPVTKDHSVKFIDTQGIYDAGKTRTNMREAELIVDAISQHYLSGAKQMLSVGVITFNAPQQALIERLLDAKRLAIPQLDIAITESIAEPIFIKNLENVQGDERDIILFSITFGPDKTGKLSINFGPINKEGGHRRLNVAVSRARYEVRIFSSMRPEEIDLAKTKSRGVADLKAYLDFALHGVKVLGTGNLPSLYEPESLFETEVIRVLRNHGWIVHSQVGVSGYKIDLAVVNPSAPDCYLLGIECDGATYYSAATTRDRDRLRQMVLEGLGWNIYRLWSTDWWLDPEAPTKRLLNYLEQLRLRQ